jgi:hypothetical protein
VDYLIWNSKDEGNSCMVEGPEGVDRSWELKEGVPRAATFPADACFRMSDRHKKAVRLTDSLLNMSRLVVVSPALKTLLEAEAPKGVEYLKVSIFNHKGRVASPDYFIVHAVGLQDCLDLAQSNPSYNHIVPTDIDWVDKLVLDHGKIDPDAKLFRIKDFGMMVIVRRDLAEAIEGGGFKGVEFLELSEYEG